MGSYAMRRFSKYGPAPVVRTVSETTEMQRKAAAGIIYEKAMQAASESGASYLEAVDAASTAMAKALALWEQADAELRAAAAKPPA